MLANALDETEVLGVRTNIRFVRALVARLNDQDVRVDTELVERELTRLLPESGPAPDEAYAVAAAAVASGARQPQDPWTATGACASAKEARRRSPFAKESASAPSVSRQRSIHLRRPSCRPVDEAHRWVIDGAAAAAAASNGVVWHECRGGGLGARDDATRARVEQTPAPLLAAAAAQLRR